MRINLIKFRSEVVGCCCCCCCCCCSRTRNRILPAMVAQHGGGRYKRRGSLAWGRAGWGGVGCTRVEKGAAGVPARICSHQGTNRDTGQSVVVSLPAVGTAAAAPALPCPALPHGHSLAWYLVPIGHSSHLQHTKRKHTSEAVQHTTDTVPRVTAMQWSGPLLGRAPADCGVGNL